MVLMLLLHYCQRYSLDEGAGTVVNNQRYDEHDLWDVPALEPLPLHQELPTDTAVAWAKDKQKLENVRDGKSPRIHNEDHLQT